MFIGTLGAIKQNKLKRLLAYSSIAHIGYLLIGLSTGTIESIESLLIYVILYIITIIGIFNIILITCQYNFNIGINQFYKSINYKFYAHSYINFNNNKLTDQNQNSFNILILQKILNIIQNKNNKKIILLNKTNKYYYIKHLTDLSSLSRTNPILALTFSIILFSNAGIPPLAGSYGKLNIFLTAIENTMYFLAISGILCSVIGSFYSIRVIKIIYYHKMFNNV